jgi:cytochrome c-type biogenesis protein CcmH/NrfF
MIDDAKTCLDTDMPQTIEEIMDAGSSDQHISATS